MSIERNQEAREKAFADPSSKIDDTEEARARALAEKPFRDVAVGRPDADRDVLERVADEQGDKAGQEFREMKELLPTEVIDKLSKDLAEKLETDPAGKSFTKLFPTYFKELIISLKYNLEKEGKNFSREDILSMSQGRLFNLGLEGKNFRQETRLNALCSVLGVGETVGDVFETFRRLPENQRQEVAALVGEKVGDAIATVDRDAYVVIPTKINGVLLSAYRDRSLKINNLDLKFTPEFLERAMKQI